MGITIRFEVCLRARRLMRLVAVQDMLKSYISVPETVGEPQEALQRFTWLLFLVIRHRLQLGSTDLVALFHLLLPVIAAVYDHAPVSSRRPLSSDCGVPPGSTLMAFVHIFKASPAQVRAMILSGN